VNNGCGASCQITEAMLDAGVAEYFTWNQAEDSPRQIVEAVFRAMQKLVAQPPRARSESP